MLREGSMRELKGDKDRLVISEKGTIMLLF